MDKETLKIKTDFICERILKILAYCERHPEHDKGLQVWLIIHQELEKIIGGNNVQEKK